MPISTTKGSCSTPNGRFVSDSIARAPHVGVEAADAAARTQPPFRLDDR